MTEKTVDWDVKNQSNIYVNGMRKLHILVKTGIQYELVCITIHCVQMSKDCSVYSLVSSYYIMVVKAFTCQLLVSIKIVNMIRKYNNHKLQTNL